jgi:hypothetical protein
VELLALNDRFWDWEVRSWDAQTLTLIADNDLTYHHAAEVAFHEVQYLRIVDEFSHPRFRQPTVEEASSVEAILGRLTAADRPRSVWSWDAETVGGSGSFLVVASRVAVTIGHVPHQ